MPSRPLYTGEFEDNPLGISGTLSETTNQMLASLGGISNPIPQDWFNPTNDYGASILKRNWHQLVVIGNGFDLECGLPSSFAFFMSDRQNRLNANNIEEPDGTSQIYTPTLWDIILDPSRNSNWRDIEGEIANWTVPVFDHNGKLKFDRTYEVLKYMRYRNSTYRNRGIEGSVSKYIREHPSIDINNLGQSELLKFYRNELGILERDFNAYLTKAVEETPEYKTRANELIFALLCEERPEVNSFSISESILSFNYTRSAERLNTLDHDINYINIHGRLGGEIVFGIDGTGLLSNPDIAPFTKTYRLMNLDLPDTGTLVHSRPNSFDDEGTALIKFYGHSLGEADYSYFQAIFDAVGLYEGPTRLIFYFRPHNDQNEHAARKAMMERAMKLLSAYGKTLDNEDHGKNLIHKLLIEGRLSVKPLPYGRVRAAECIGHSWFA